MALRRRIDLAPGVQAAIVHDGDLVKEPSVEVGRPLR